jgi:hypothetical protein
MRNSIFIFVLMIAISGLALAQGRTRVQSDEDRKVQGYALIGLGDFSDGGPTGFQIGGGVDAFVFKGSPSAGNYPIFPWEINYFSREGYFFSPQMDPITS